MLRFPNFLLKFWDERTEFRLKTERSQAKRLTKVPVKQRKRKHLKHNSTATRRSS